MLTAAAALLVLGVGCGSSSGPDAAEGTAGGASVTNVTLGYVPYADDAALFYAQRSGIFRRHGLNVSLVAQANPVAIEASMQSGTEQFGFVTTPVLINLNSKGVAVKCVSSVDGQQPASPARGGTVLVTARRSGITSVRGLAGMNVAMAQLGSLASLDLDILATRAGIDPTSIHQVAIPFPQMAAALSQGRVQAAIMVYPFADSAIAAGATVLEHPDAVLFPGGTIVCLDALGSYISAHSAVVANFRAAMDQAITYSARHPSAAKATLAEYLNLTPAAAQQQILSTNWKLALNTASIARIEDYMKQFGQIQSEPPASSMIWSPAG